MTTRPLIFAALALFAIASILVLGCGAGRRLETVSLSPSSADAQNFPNGQVQFTATGTYSRPPSPVQLTSKDVVWCMGGIGDSSGRCVGLANPGGFVDQNGLAQCSSLYTGTATVLAGIAVFDSNPLPDSGAQLKIFGAATLTCP